MTKNPYKAIKSYLKSLIASKSIPKNPIPGPRDEPHNCPKCGADLLGKPIPQEHLQHYGGAKYFKRELSQYDFDQDRTVCYVCPDCREKWI